jgi:hypothetical protein
LAKLQAKQWNWKFTPPVDKTTCGAIIPWPKVSKSGSLEPPNHYGDSVETPRAIGAIFAKLVFRRYNRVQQSGASNSKSNPERLSTNVYHQSLALPYATLPTSDSKSENLINRSETPPDATLRASDSKSNAHINRTDPSPTWTLLDLTLP